MSFKVKIKTKSQLQKEFGKEWRKIKPPFIHDMDVFLGKTIEVDFAEWAGLKCLQITCKSAGNHAMYYLNFEHIIFENKLAEKLYL